MVLHCNLLCSQMFLDCDWIVTATFNCCIISNYHAFNSAMETQHLCCAVHACQNFALSTKLVLSTNTYFNTNSAHSNNFI